MSEDKKARRGLGDLDVADREIAVMQRCRKAIATLPTMECRTRVVQWLGSVAGMPVPDVAQQKRDPRQLDLVDSTEDPFPTAGA